MNEHIFLVIGAICDTVLMSLFIWHCFIRTRKLNKEIHDLKKAIKKCPYKDKRAK